MPSPHAYAGWDGHCSEHARYDLHADDARQCKTVTAVLHGVCHSQRPLRRADHRRQLHPATVYKGAPLRRSRRRRSRTVRTASYAFLIRRRRPDQTVRHYVRRGEWCSSAAPSMTAAQLPGTATTPASTSSDRPGRRPDPSPYLSRAADPADRHDLHASPRSSPVPRARASETVHASTLVDRAKPVRLRDGSADRYRILQSTSATESARVIRTNPHQ